MIRFRAFGSARLAGDEGAEYPSVLARPKLVGLLSYLAASTPPGFQRRDTLLGLFWADVDQERARRALRQSLYHLRQALGDDVILGRGDDEVGLAPDLFWSDVAAFDAALERGELEEALDLYQGDLLQGFFLSEAPEFEQWLDRRRTELRDAAATAAWTLAEHGLNQRNPAGAAYWGRRAVSLAPLDERLLRRLIKLLDRVGDRAGAVREYESFARRLGEALELEPSPETRALVDEVRARSQVPPDRVTAATVGGPAGRASKESPGDGGTTRSGDEASAVEPTPAPDDVAGAPVAADHGRQFGGDAQRLATALHHRYVLERTIGTGGTATVYLARDMKHDRHVAVKVFEPELAAVLGSQRFLQEIKITAKLEHPHILTLIDSGEADSFLYYVMPYVEGESLRGKLRRERQLALEEALEITTDVARALDYAHRRGVIHRDIKPENILIHEGTAIVADFGIALAVRAAGGTRLTQTGLSLGTPSYMSPEQATGDQQLDQRSDIYSLGAVLYEMLVGEPPYTGPSSQAIIAKLVTERPTRPRTLRDTIPAAVDETVMKALAQLPADRFATVGEFAAALEPTTASQSVDTGAKRPRIRRRALIAVVAATALAAATALVASLWNQSPSPAPNRVLVTPFENRTGDTTLALLGSMTADWIVQGLRSVEVIDVVPTASSIIGGSVGVGATERTAATDAQMAAARAGAALVVAGAYYRRGDSLEFQAQVIEPTGERLLNAVPPVAGPVAAAGDVIAELSQQLVRLLAANLDPRVYDVVGEGQPPGLEAYREFLTGRALFESGRMHEAIEYFYRATALDAAFFDPRYFLILSHYNTGAWAVADSNAKLLESARTRMTAQQRAAYDWAAALVRGNRMDELVAARAAGHWWDIVQAALHVNRPREALGYMERIRETDYASVYPMNAPTDPTTGFNFWHAITSAYHMLGEHERELQEARKGREQFPQHFSVLQDELFALVALGRIDDVMRGIEESLLLPPQSGWSPPGLMRDVAREMRGHGHREAALAVLRRAIDWYLMRPADEMAATNRRGYMLELYYFSERWDDAAAIAAELAAEFPMNIDYRGFLGTLAARRGDEEEALRISDSLNEFADPYNHGWHTYWQACMAAQLGELERAMMLLRDAYSQGRKFDLGLHRDIDLEPLHDYPPFQEFLRPKG